MSNLDSSRSNDRAWLTQLSSSFGSRDCCQVAEDAPSHPSFMLACIVLIGILHHLPFQRHLLFVDVSIPSCLPFLLKCRLECTSLTLFVHRFPTFSHEGQALAEPRAYQVRIVHVFVCRAFSADLLMPSSILYRPSKRIHTTPSFVRGGEAVCRTNTRVIR
jgi:hypothetical protein